MAYTPYSQALPDTSRYTLDPVLQERLYQPVRPDPYQGGLLSSWADDYYADPFGYTNKRFGNLDEVLATDAPEVGLGGMFAPAPPPMYGSDADGGFGGDEGQDGGTGGFGLGMDIGGVDAGIAGPGAGLGMSGQQGGIIGAVLGGLFGMPGLGYQIGKSVTEDAPTTVTPQSVVNAAYQTAAVNAARDARNANESGATPAAQAAANTIANEAAIAAAQSSGSAPTGLGGDLGTGASDAAGFGGYGGVW